MCAQLASFPPLARVANPKVAEPIIEFAYPVKKGQFLDSRPPSPNLYSTIFSYQIQPNPTKFLFNPFPEGKRLKNMAKFLPSIFPIFISHTFPHFNILVHLNWTDQNIGQPHSQFFPMDPSPSSVPLHSFFAQCSLRTNIVQIRLRTASSSLVGEGRPFLIPNGQQAKTAACSLCFSWPSTTILLLPIFSPFIEQFAPNSFFLFVEAR